MKDMDVHRRSLGIYLDDKNTAQIRVWAPDADSVDLLSNNITLSLTRDDQGYWTGSTTELHLNDTYRYRLNGDPTYPDPASMAQPEGVHGPSQIAAPETFRWSDDQWKNHDLQAYIFYEIHTGTFSEEGSFEGIEKNLDHLVELGITAIEIMPVAQFPGSRNWGYDGVFPYAVQNSYGGWQGLQKLVDACHKKNLAVVLDVVYNHLGPEGNYLTFFGPYATDKYKTPWGGAVNFDDAWSDEVRRYVIENVLMWFRDFHIDALRLDAVHAIRDFSPRHILQDIRIQVDKLMKATGRRHYLIIESDLNDTRYIDPLEKNGYGMDGQWIDEFHHALRIAAGGERHGYYSDFNGIEHLAKAYRDAYVYDGQYSPHRKRTFGVKTDHPGQQFVVFSQNHDQVGNRMLGERTSHLTGLEMQKLLAGAVLVSPYLPLLFMGEEWSAPHPFLYFVSHSDQELIEAVRKGRRAEFAAFHSEGEAPDPVSEESFVQSKLQWNLLREKHHKALFDYYKALIALRKTQPALAILNRTNLESTCSGEKQMLTLRRWTEEEEVLCLMNFSREEQTFSPKGQDQEWTKIFDSAAPEWMGPKAAPDAISKGSSITLQPESILIYASQKNTVS